MCIKISKIMVTEKYTANLESHSDKDAHVRLLVTTARCMWLPYTAS